LKLQQQQQARVEAQRESEEAQKPKKPKWKEAVDPASGKKYYFHRKTKEVSWERPAAYIPLDPA